jgi:hypothetical protein
MASVPFNNLITFSRGSNATLTGPTGLIQWAPNNLLTNSESFNASAWSKSDATVTANATTAPDGTSTADKLAETATTAQHYLFQSAGAAGAHTATIYAKAAERSWLIVTLNSSNTFFNISSGTVGSVPGGFIASITDAGNGWYRCSVTATLPASGPIVFWTSTANNVTSYAGTAGSGIFIWGAQLELGTAATTYNSTTVKNLLGFSEAFDNATWTKARASIVTGAQANPVNGAFNAQKLMEDTSNNSHFAQQAVASIVGGTTVTVSAYVKAAGRNFFVIVTSDQAGTFRTSYFDLANGTLGTVASGHTASITAVGNGWYRCAITQAQSATTGVFTYYPSLAAVNGSTSYQGDGNSGIYIYGAQLSDSASLDPYVPTPAAAPSSTAYYGPRFDYDPVTLAPKGLLVEEARTNLNVYSQTLSDANWNASGATKTSTNNVDPAGTTTALLLTADGASSTHFISASITNVISFVSGTTYTASYFVKPGTATRIQITLPSSAFGASQYANFLLTGSGSVSASSGGTATITPSFNGYYRITWTATATGASSASSGALAFIVSGSETRLPTNTSSENIFIWGGQVEAGAFATSYIPTVASTVTRAADVATITGSLFSQWYGQTEGTFTFSGDSTYGNGGFIGSTPTTGAILYANTNASRTFNGTNFITSANTYTNNAVFSTALGYSASGRAIVLNSGTVASDVNLIQTPTAITLGGAFGGGYLNGHIRSINFIPARAADFQLQALTS